MVSPLHPLSILHVVNSLDVGGLERIVVDLAIAQHQAGHRVAVFSIDQTAGLRSQLETAGVPVVIGDKRGTLDRTVLRRLRAAVTDARVDVLHSHNFVPNYYAALATLAMRTGPLLINTCHNMGTRLSNRRLRWLYRCSLLRTARVAMVGQQVHDRLVRTGIVRADRALTVMNGVVTGKFSTSPARRASARKALDVSGEAPVIGCVGRLVALKNHSLLLAQLPELLRTHPRLQVVIIGEGPLRDALSGQIDALGIAGHARLLGARPDVADLLPGLDIFALPSQTEGLSIALLEACASSLPVVATAVGGNPQIIRDGETGLLVPVDDGDALVKALDSLLVDTSLRAGLGANAQNWVQENASIEAMRDAYDALYRQV